MFWHFTKQPRYYSAVDEVREAYEAKPQRRFSPRSSDRAPRQDGQPRTQHVQHYDEPSAGDNPLGKLPGSVWTIPTEPLRVPDHLGIDHFAAFPTEFPRRIITGWSPRGVCVECGAGRRPVSTPTGELGRHPGGKHRADVRTYANLSDAALVVRTITDEACDCPEPTAPTTPGVVLDPFGGTGTTALVADVLGRDAISVDLSADYCRLAEWRTNDPAQRAKAARVEPPPPVLDGQLSLFGDPA